MERLAIKILQRRMVAFSMLALLLTGGVVAAVAIIPLAGLLGDAARHEVVHIHSLTAQGLGQHARTLEGLALQVTSRSRIREELQALQAGNRSAAEVGAFTAPKLADALRLADDMKGILRRAADGRTVAAVGRAVPANLPLPPTPAVPLLVGPLMDDGESVLVVAAPIRDDRGGVIGSDTIVFSAQGLAPLLRPSGLRATYLGRTGGGRVTWFAVDRQGLLRPTTPPVRDIGMTGLAVTDTRTMEGTRAVVVSDRHGETGWQVLTIAPADDVYADVRHVTILAAIATAIAVAVGALGLLLMLRPLGGTLLVQAEDMERQLVRQRDLGLDLEHERRRLADSNAELEQFAYAASHDLQQPLRMISGFLDLLRRRYADRLDDDGRDYVDYAVNGARQLQQMIEGLLEYSRVGRLEQAHRPTDLTEAAEQATHLLAVRTAETQSVVHIDPLPTLAVEPRQMVRLFQNLIDNALKYRHPDRQPRIRISAEQCSKGWCIHVTDNGLGFSPDQQREAFGLFRRLHPDLAVEGTGLGLALCQKIVHRHGGTITLQSTEGEGTTFSIWLPREDTGGTAACPVNRSASAGVDAVEDLDDVAGVAETAH